MSTPTINKHPKYYLDDGNIVFLTSDKTLFRLHKSVLRRHSAFFNDMFEHAHPPTKDSKGVEIPVDGSSDDHLIELGGHALATLYDHELESICAVLYDMPLTPPSELQIDQAVSLLKVASKFQFGAIHSKAVQMLDKALLPPGQRYRLAIDCLVDSWIVRSYVDICSTVDPISTDLVADFSLRNESNKVSALMMVRENHRAMLLVFVHGSQFAPYPSTAAGINTNLTSVCANCLPTFKQLLLRILQNGGHSDLDGADASKLPLLEDRMLKGIQPRTQNSLAICATCRAREKAAVAQILGTEDLVKEVKKVMHLVF